MSTNNVKMNNKYPVPFGLKALIAFVILAVSSIIIYFGWVVPLRKLYDPKIKNKIPAMMTLMLLGICGPVIILLLHLVSCTRRTELSRTRHP